MARDDERRRTIRFTLPETSTSDLRGRQSVRATFKLTEKAIDALSIVSIHLGIKQKSLFDHLIEDSESLDAIARELESLDFGRLNRVQKTYVLSRKTLYSLERAAKTFDTPRDALVEYSIQRLLPIIIKEREKHLKRKEILEELTGFIKNGAELLEKSEEKLGKEDPVYDRLRSAMAGLINAYQHIDDYIEKGKVIEEFD
jgi:hypothetical protein